MLQNFLTLAPLTFFFFKKKNVLKFFEVLHKTKPNQSYI
jgi:hypothetical protein